MQRLQCLSHWEVGVVGMQLQEVWIALRRAALGELIITAVALINQALFYAVAAGPRIEHSHTDTHMLGKWTDYRAS